MNHPCFDPNRFPLNPGLRLLEASAGTGKTFALAHLVLRLLSEGPRPLQVEQLLVVTFTEAAAAELRDRIARRLQQGLALLQGANPEAMDSTLQEWMTSQSPTMVRQLEGRLLLALERLDHADITTIHGFCRRTLQRQALEAGLGPAVSLESQSDERREQVVHDYWQAHVLPLSPRLLGGLQQRGLQRDGLIKALASLDSDPALQLDALPQGLQSDRPLVEQLHAEWEARWQRFLTQWTCNADALEADLAAAAQELKSLGLPYSPYRLKAKPDRLQNVQRWIDSLEGHTPGYDAVLAQKELKTYFHPGPFTKVAAPAHGERVSLPQPHLMEAIAAMVDGPAETVLLHFCHWGRQELNRRRERSGQMSFGQLLSQLDPGAEADSINPLLQTVAKRYRAALIDEFQDTDPIQWRILERTFTADPPRHLLVMVGDPKQAIYRFRGGELATYRLAATRTDHCYGLYENRRSSAGLVQALNALMRPGLQRSQLAVPAVEAKAEKGDLALPHDQAPLQLLNLDPHQLDRQVATFCQQLLEQQWTLSTQHGTRVLKPGDLCLLVSQHSQAEALRAALERRHLPSRLVSKGDVFESLGAATLQRCLDALALPGNNNRLRLLAGSPLLGWSAAEIQTAQAQDWDRLAAALSNLKDRLPHQGLTAVLAELQGSEGLARLSLRGRTLADLQQAAELVQEQMHKLGLGALQAADWLRRQRLQDHREIPETHQCRSDAAESAIAVVTVHRSKGMEYPVVICPFLWKGSKTIKADARQLGRRWMPSPDGQPHLDLHLNPHWGQGRRAAHQDQWAQAAEAERLAYVACTRAQHMLVLGWPGVDQAEPANPLSPWLVEGGVERDLPVHRCATDTLKADADNPIKPWQPATPEGCLALGPTPSRPLDSRWGRSSYSAWAHAQTTVPPAMREDGRDTDALHIEPTEEQRASIDHVSVAQQRPTPWPELGALATFPRGAGPGDALHRILERIDYGSLAAGNEAQARAILAEELPRAGLSNTWEDTLITALCQLMQTPMGGALGPCRLGDLQTGHWLNEMNFDLPLAHNQPDRLVRSSGLAQVFSNHPGGLFDGSYGQRLNQLDVASRGFLTGSIDLIFCWQGKWWVADWKSNWIGQRDDKGTVQQCGPNNYSQEAMVELMVTNHYPLQAHLYLVALHRYLHWRLPNYNADEHLGGYAYIFLRGVPGALDVDRLRPDHLAAAAPTPGMLVDQPSLQRVLALDALLREGQP
ncbi:MAG: UvrD-helicase domain-containing protein [Synechococcus sp.]